MDSLFYIILTGLGLTYFIIAAFSDIDFLIGRFSLGLPYGLLGWGVLGFLSTEEPFGFLLGFLLPFFAIGLIYYYTTSSGKKMEELLFQEGTVNIAIAPNKKGEVKVPHGNGFDFYVAAAENISKPIPKSSKVKIINIDGVVVFVTTDLTKIKKLDKRSDFYNRMFRIIQFLAPRPKISGTCMICYGGLIKSKLGIRCPYCQQVAHKQHLKEWLELKEKCPNCRTQLDWKGEKLVINKG
ncbi:MAG: hypothetical protein ACXAD7_14865 [Candidatus Kariarchaeaceae archaeon]|jgi:hypothetical protein